MGYNPSICTQVAIGSTNKYLDVWANTGGAGTTEAVTLTEQDYNDIVTLCAAIQTGLRALASGEWASATCSVIFTGSVPGMIEIDNTGGGSSEYRLLWSSGANAANTVGSVLGFSVAADDTGAKTYTSDYQSQYAWYALRAPVKYGPWTREEIGGESQITLSSKNMKVVHVGFRRHYELVLAELVPELMFAAEATGSDVNRDLETEWQRMAQGQWFRYREDQEVTGTYVDCFLQSPRNWFESVTRPHLDYHSYNVTMRFLRKES